MRHELKCWSPVYEDIIDGIKTAEWRRDDRPQPYAVGDQLELREWDPVTETYSGRRCLVLVAHCTRCNAFGIPAGYVMMSISLISLPEGAS